jgi:hypothetical protein
MLAHLPVIPDPSFAKGYGMASAIRNPRRVVALRGSRVIARDDELNY